MIRDKEFVRRDLMYQLTSGLLIRKRRPDHDRLVGRVVYKFFTFRHAVAPC